jgi:hypothetical protein
MHHPNRDEMLASPTNTDNRILAKTKEAMQEESQRTKQIFAEDVKDIFYRTK